ncbi:FHA domain-containing protein [Herbaspirillum sp. RV1423]|uniref:FHA domain-containing protein n=1 Tax=Herbaspirillum sp. RV1423 TaxID=1443993 RepID=UPI0004BB5F7E|nr:FHA domain-containing protein [Herbaspirillum sp. RV1423]
MYDMYELRVLNGYHRGATLPLTGETLTIGAGDTADVVLADPGIEETHAELAPSSSGWTLQSLDGAVRGADSNQAVASLALAPGDFVRVDHIWLAVVQQNSPWQEPPAEPGDAATPADAATDEAMRDAALADSADNTETAVQAEQTGPTAAADAMNAHVSERAAQPGFLSRKRQWLFAPVALTAILSAAAAYAMTRTYTPLSVDGEANTASVDDMAAWRPTAVAQEDMHRTAKENGTAQPERMLNLPRPDLSKIDQATRSRKEQGKTDRMADMKAVSIKSGPALSPEELRSAFRKRLAEVDLLKRFNLQLEDRFWSLQAALEEEDAERFQRMLSAFVRKYNIDFPVEVKIGSAEAMLPFKIQQVISGNNASIVTDDGRRLYVGDEYRGMKLAGIEGNQLSFTGKRSINVTW